MAQPSPSQVGINRPLTNISIAYMQATRDYVADRVFPVIPVDKQSDSYYVFDRGDWFRDDAQVRPPATESAGGGYNLSTDSYNAKVYAFHKDIADQVRANYDSILDADREATEFVVSRLLLRRERAWAEAFFQTGVWGTDATAGSGFTAAWSDYASSDPKGDIKSLKRTMHAATGFRPNKLVLGAAAYDTLQDHPDLRDQIKYTGRETITEELMANLLGVDEILVLEGMYNSANEGATDSLAYIANENDALLVYAAPRAGLMTPSAGYTFAWRGVSDGMGETIGTVKFYMEALRADRIESQQAFDHKVVAADLGIFLSGVVV